MIKQAFSGPRKIYGPTPRQLVWSAFKGAGMGALLVIVAAKILV